MFLVLTFYYVYANISNVMERKPRYMEPVKLVNRENNLTYARAMVSPPLQIGDEVKLPDYDQ